jgi:hypothetical protein
VEKELSESGKGGKEKPTLARQFDAGWADVMSTFNILFISFVVAFIANLVHWHGRDRYFYRPQTVAGRGVRIAVRSVVIFLLVLGFTHILTVDFVLNIFFGLLVIQHMLLIWRRHRERVQRHAVASA